MAHLIIWNSLKTDEFHHTYQIPTRALGAHVLASWLANFGYKVKVIDFCNLLTPDELFKITEKTSMKQQ